MDLHETKKLRYGKMGPQLVKALQSRQFEAFYCPTKEEALKKALTLIPSDHTVSWGGSETLKELGLLQAVKENYKVIDRDLAKSFEERVDLMRQSLLCDTYLMSSNAVSEDGILVNIDGNGNRVAALSFGPKSVVMVIGMNKVVKTQQDAISRTRNIAGPTNTLRFEGKKTPCSVTGECADCKTPDCICGYLSITRFCAPKGKIKVILVGDDFGF